jgi:hypothetical protein
MVLLEIMRSHLICLVIRADIGSTSGMELVFLSCTRVETHIFSTAHEFQLIFFQLHIG